MSEKIKVSFGYGALSPSLEEQANKQGFTLGDKAEFLEKLRESKMMLMFHVLTPSESDRISQKIHKLVMKELKPKAIDPTESPSDSGSRISPNRPKEEII